MADLQVTTSVVEGVAANVQTAAGPLSFGGKLTSADSGAFQSAAVSGALADSSGLRGARAQQLESTLDALQRTTAAAAAHLDQVESGLAKKVM
ncbi:MAG: hypothetical protein ABJB03_03015 [Rhodoglobus sp.]